MSDLAATVNKRRTTSLCIHVPSHGAWRAEAVFDTLLEPDALAGDAAVAIGETQFVGTFVSRATGSFQLQSRGRVVAGKAALGRVLKPKHYHSDAGILTKTVAGDAIREAGEAAGTSDLTSERLGVDLVRCALPASFVLDQVLPPHRWWVDYAGQVCIGDHADVEVSAKYEILDYDPTLQVASITTDDPAAIVVGSILRQRLATPLRVNELDMTVADGKLRLTAWCEGAV